MFAVAFVPTFRFDLVGYLALNANLVTQVLSVVIKVNVSFANLGAEDIIHAAQDFQGIANGIGGVHKYYGSISHVICFTRIFHLVTSQPFTTVIIIIEDVETFVDHQIRSVSHNHAVVVFDVGQNGGNGVLVRN